MEQSITITAKSIFWLCGAIVSLGGAATIISSWTSPFKKLKARVDKIEHHQNSDNLRLKELEDGQRVTMRSMLAIVSHLRTGNDMEKLRNSEEEINDYLIAK
jgi:hypothetical protein